MSTIQHLRQLLVVSGVVLALASIATPSYAAITELIFSEYIEGSGNNKALEIYNGTGSAIDLATAGYNVQIYYNGNLSAATPINLSGTVLNNDVFVLRNTGADIQGIINQADQAHSQLSFNGNDTVILRKGTMILDVIGQIGDDPDLPGTFGIEGWGTSPTTTSDATLQRKGTIWAGYPYTTMFPDTFDPSVQWNGFPLNTVSGLGTHSVVPIPPTLYLMGGGLLGFIGLKRKMRRK